MVPKRGVERGGCGGATHSPSWCFGQGMRSHAAMSSRRSATGWRAARRSGSVGRGRRRGGGSRPTLGVSVQGCYESCATRSSSSSPMRRMPGNARPRTRAHMGCRGIRKAAVEDTSAISTRCPVTASSTVQLGLARRRPGSAARPGRGHLRERSTARVVAAGGHCLVTTSGQIPVAAHTAPPCERDRS